MQDLRIRRCLLVLCVVIYLLFSLVTGTMIPSDWDSFASVVFVIFELVCIALIIGNYYEHGDDEPLI